MAERIPVPRFAGGTGRLKSPQASTERTINRFVETTKGLGGKVERYLRQTEGITPFAQVVATDTSELLYQDGRCFACTGTVFSEVLDNGTTIPYGTITYSAAGKATMVCSGTVASGSGGHQVMIVSSAGDVYVFDTLTLVFTQVVFNDGSPIVVSMCEFMDGYFFALRLNSRRVYYSTLEDALTWDFTFGYFERSWGSDNISFIKRSGRQLWVVGTKTSEVWADTGNANSPFAPIQGALIDQGCVAKFSGQRDGETLTWLNLDERGGGLVVRASGYTPQEISTYPLAVMVQQRATVGVLNACEAFVHQMEQHRFYWLHVPNIDTTPTFDFTEQDWHERAMWDIVHGVWEPHIARCHAYAFEKHLIGVRESGYLYELASDYYDDGVL